MIVIRERQIHPLHIRPPHYSKELAPVRMVFQPQPPSVPVQQASYSSLLYSSLIFLYSSFVAHLACSLQGVQQVRVRLAPSCVCVHALHVVAAHLSLLILLVASFCHCPPGILLLLAVLLADLALLVFLY